MANKYILTSVLVVLVAANAVLGRPYYMGIPLDEFERYTPEQIYSASTQDEVIFMPRQDRAIELPLAESRILLVEDEDDQPIAVPRMLGERSLKERMNAEPSAFSPVQEEPTLVGSGSDLNLAEDRHHPGHHSDHVDFGAYTGGHGAFGWYTDHPVGHH